MGPAALPCASVELHVTVVVPIGNCEPDAGAQLTGVVPSTASVAGGNVKVTIAPALDVASAEAFACAAVTGAVVSLTTTSNVVGVAALPCASVELHVTVVVPMANWEPDAGAHVTVVEPSTASVAPGTV